MLSLNYDALDSSDKKYIRFVDPDTWQDMFLLEDGKKLLFHDSYDHTDRAVTCKYIDPYHFYFGSTVFTSTSSPSSCSATATPTTL